MLQTLFYFPCELFGLPVFGFGLLFAVWAVASVVAVARLFRRQGINADTLSYVLVLAVMGTVIAWLLPLLCDSRGLPVRGYGMMMLLAVLSGIGLSAYRARRVGVDPEMIFALAFWLIVPGILGARAVYVGEYWYRDFWPEYKDGLGALIFSICNIAAGGLVVYGAFFGAMIGLGLFWWRHRVPLLATADLIAPSMLLGLALGRVGCLLNGCCYGGACDLPWKVTFPWGSPVSQNDAEHGITELFGLKFRDGPNHLPVIDAVTPDLAAARQGLHPGMAIFKINGMKLLPRERQKATPKELAASAVMGMDKLTLVFSESGEEFSPRPIDDPPSWQTDRRGGVKIYGLEIDGSDDQEAIVTYVRPQSAEAASGIRPGQRLESISGRSVATIGELRRLLDEHRQQPWLSILPAGHGYIKPIELSVDRPLPRSQPVHPTQIYSTIDALILCFLLLCYDRFRRRDGVLTALMLTVYPVTRFLIEKIRTDEAGIWGTGLHISQNISLAILPCAILLWIYIFRRPAKLAFGGDEMRGK
jgi:prolipoprotein diacylglyceryltransferase